MTQAENNIRVISWLKQKTIFGSTQGPTLCRTQVCCHASLVLKRTSNVERRVAISQEECMLRFKYLADMLKKRKEAETKQEDGEAAATEEASEPAAANPVTSTVNSSAAERCLDSADS